MMLSPHFSLAELTRSQIATRRGIDNTPPASAIERLRLLCVHVLEPVRDRFGPFSPSSGYRSPALNRVLGSKDNSQHCKGEAADFAILGIANIEVARWIAVALDFDQLILEFYSDADPTAGWVHCSYKASGNRREFLTINKAGTQRGLPGV
ncbi:MAG: peptidase M15A [Proteobacteria bacterium]|nr:MAG: peptidase M15A [Pseudomonadota bacterium]